MQQLHKCVFGFVECSKCCSSKDNWKGERENSYTSVLNVRSQIRVIFKGYSFSRPTCAAADSFRARRTH